MHPAATGGTATLTMACDTDCSGFDGGAGLAMLENAGPAIAPHRFADAAAIDAADAREERRRECESCHFIRRGRNTATDPNLQIPTPRS